jgi:hypothetical protein
MQRSTITTVEEKAANNFCRSRFLLQRMKIAKIRRWLSSDSGSMARHGLLMSIGSGPKAKRRKLMTKTTGILRDIMNKIYEVPEETLLKRNGNRQFKAKNTWWIEYKDLNPLLESDPKLREHIIDGIRLANVISRYIKLMTRMYGEKVYKIVFEEYEDIENDTKYLVFAIQKGKPSKKAPNLSTVT